MREYYKIPEDDRLQFIETSILSHTPDDSNREALGSQLEMLIDLYAGCDDKALSVLHLAARQHRLPEFIRRLEVFYEDAFRHIHPEHRTDPTIAAAAKLPSFFGECYRDLGIPYTDN